MILERTDKKHLSLSTGFDARHRLQPVLYHVTLQLETIEHTGQKETQVVTNTMIETEIMRLTTSQTTDKAPRTCFSRCRSL